MPICCQNLMDSGFFLKMQKNWNDRLEVCIRGQELIHTGTERFLRYGMRKPEGIRQKGNTPGRILNVSNDGIEVATAKGSSLLIKVVQVPNKKRMSVEDFIKGNDVEIGSMLG